MLQVKSLRVGYSGADVLNGIAWDKAGDRIFVTGKKWPLLFQIELVANAARHTTSTER